MTNDDKKLKDEIDKFLEEEDVIEPSEKHEGHDKEQLAQIKSHFTKDEKSLDDEESIAKKEKAKLKKKKEALEELETHNKKEEREDEAPVEAAGKAPDLAPPSTHIFALRTTANREDQVMSFITSNVVRKKIPVYSVVRPHGMRGYIFIETETAQDAEQSAFGVPYARGILGKEIDYKEIEHMLERVKKDVNILKNDIVEIISGPFKREKAKITRIDKTKEEVVVELLEAAVPIPMTMKIDAVKVIRRDTPDEDK
jgi:transcriptional antiterminator NusG